MHITSTVLNISDSKKNVTALEFVKGKNLEFGFFILEINALNA
jgi:hypothetical protein